MNLDKEFIQQSAKQLMDKISPTQRLRLFGLGKIPLLFCTSPQVLELNNERCRVLIPLNYVTKNHLRSMYFGALAIGADCSGGLLAQHLIDQQSTKVSLIFKSFKADFLKRPEQDVEFVCRDGAKILDLIKRVIATGERDHIPMEIEAFCGADLVAKFELVLSLKAKS